MESTTQGRTGPLAGMLVVELGTLIAGPFAGRLLGDMGARVIKIEDPGRPDPLRTWGRAGRAGTLDRAPPQSRSLSLHLNRGAIFRELVGRAGGGGELPPRRTRRSGAGPTTARGQRPGDGRVSGYGQTVRRPRGQATRPWPRWGAAIQLPRPPPRMALSLGDTGGMSRCRASSRHSVTRHLRAWPGGGWRHRILPGRAESVIPDYNAAGGAWASGTRLEDRAVELRAADGT